MSVIDQRWHGTKKCAVNGAKIPRDLQVAGHRCPLCGNTLGANFDGTVKPGFDSPSAPTAMVAEYVQRRRAARERKRIRREVEFARYEYRNFNDLRIKGLVLEGSGLMAEQDFARAESFQDVAKTTPRWSAMEEEQFSLSSVRQWRRVWTHLADTAMLRVAVTEYGHRKDLAETCFAIAHARVFDDLAHRRRKYEEHSGPNYVAFLRLPRDQIVFLHGAIHQRFIELLDDPVQFDSVTQ